MENVSDDNDEVLDDGARGGRWGKMARGRQGLEDDGDCQLAVGALMDSAEAPFAALGSVLSRFALRSGQAGAVPQSAVRPPGRILGRVRLPKAEGQGSYTQRSSLTP